MEIVAPDVKTDLKGLDATSFAKKHGKSKTEMKNTFESAEEKVPEPGREAVGGRFTSRPPKSVIRPAPQVASEEVEQIEEGRPSQRHPLEGHEYHKKTDAELVYIAKDAHKAAEAMKSHNTTAENKYRDQANDSATVRYFRQKNGMPDWYKKKYGHIKEDIERVEEVRKMASGGRDNAGGQYYDIDNDDGTIGFGYKPRKSQPSSSHSNYEYKPEPKHPLHGKIVTAKHNNGQEVTGRMMGTEHQGTVAKIKHSSGMIHSTDAKTVKKANSGMKEDIERIEEMDKEQTPPGRDGGYQFAPGPKVSKKDIEAVKKNPTKHLTDLFAKEYAKKKMKEEVVDEAKDPKEYGYEGDMAMNQLQTIMRHAEYLMDMMKPDTDLPEWVQSKITLATDYLQTSCDYMTSEMKEAVEPPFTPNKPKTSALPGKAGKGYSTARHLARMAMQKQVDKLKKPVKESMEESRKAEIVKDIVKKKKAASEDTFQKDPELSSSLTKTQ